MSQNDLKMQDNDKCTLSDDYGVTYRHEFVDFACKNADFHPVALFSVSAFALTRKHALMT